MNAWPFLHWLLRTSWQASLLVVLVLAVQWLFRRRLSAGWQYALWFLVVIRLALPSLPTSSWSVFNVVHPPAAKTPPPPIFSQRVESPSLPASLTVPEVITPPVSDHVASIAGEPMQTLAPRQFDKQHLIRNAELVWLAGLILLAGRALVQNLVFWRKVKTAQRVTDTQTLALFDDCRELMGVAKAVPLAETEHVKSPALYGFFRPTLFLPANVMRHFTLAEQRHIFLHELAHVKRYDMALHWVATGLRMLHWFNPLLWFGFQRMAADRELACDEMALFRAGEHEARSYGETVLKLLEFCARPAALPGLMGILEEKSQMARRILRIARYKRQTRWPMLAVVLLAGLGLVTLTDAQTEKAKTQPVSSEGLARPDLVGEVHLTNGQPAAATVFIATAGPKVGTSTYCPSCYADCVKHAKTDAQGHFKIDSLDPTLLFRILVVARDCRPQYVAKVDPAKGRVNVMLESRGNAEALPGNTVMGRVLDPQGKPIEGAAVESDGVHHGNGTAWGAIEGLDPLAVTDERGIFLLTSRDAFTSLDVKVEARGFAPKKFHELGSGSATHDLMLTEGAEVSGRLMCKGKPVAGVSMGIVSADRSAENFTGNFEVGTDANGRFTFVNLPPNVEYDLYGIMNTLESYGAVQPSVVRAKGDGSRVDVGDVVVGPAHRLAGQVVLNDGKPIPDNTRILASLEDAWDNQQTIVQRDGRFELKGLPSGVATVSVRVPGYRFSTKNASLDRLNPFRLIGRVDADMTNLTLLLEKGDTVAPDYSDFSMNGGPDKLPLRGTEGGRANEQIRAPSWAISGRVTDAKTGAPLPSFLVTPGIKQFRTYSFDNKSQVEGSNGGYAIYISKHVADPFLKVQAEGYLPVAVRAPLEDRNNFDISLQPGSGPFGVVLSADGHPAANITVALLCAGRQGMAIGGDGTLNSWRDRNLVKQTQSDGRFSFPPELDMVDVAAASPQGFKLVAIADLAMHPQIRLEPWGRVTGTLHRPAGPGTNEDLDLAFATETLPDAWMLQTGNHVMTDDHGRFQFDRVPPGTLQLSYWVKMGQNGWSSTPLQSVIVKPGETAHLMIEGPEREADQRFVSPPKPAPLARKGPPIQGKVLLADGQPAVGVQVALVLSNCSLRLGKGTFLDRPEHELNTVTDDAGHFSLPTADGILEIVAAHESGFARMVQPFSNSPVMTLQPWGEIHGVLRIGRRLGANQTVKLEQNRGEGLFNDDQQFKAVTDDQGRFVITYARPGAQHLVRQISTGGPGSWVPGFAVPVDVKAGGITQVTMGGMGCEVIGKAAITDSPENFDWKDVHFSLNALPADKASANRSRWNSYPPDSATNGSFVFEDISPGTYELSARLVSGRQESHATSSRLVLLGRKTVTIPETESGGGGEPFDIGTLPLRSVQLPVESVASLTNSPFQIRLVVDADTEQVYLSRINVEKTVVLDQEAIKSAKVIRENNNEPEIELTFTDVARRRWAEFTRQNIGRRVAIIVFGKINCAPIIRSEIPGGKIWIVGKFNEQETKDLAARINDSIARP